MTFMLRILSRNTPVREHQKSERERLHGSGKFASLIGQTLTTARPSSEPATNTAKAGLAHLTPAESDRDADAFVDDTAAAKAKPVEKRKAGGLISPLLPGVAFQASPPPVEEPAPEYDAAAQALKPTITALLEEAASAPGPAATTATGDDSPVSKSEIVAQLEAESGETSSKPSKSGPKSLPAKTTPPPAPSKPPQGDAIQLEKIEAESSDEDSQAAGKKINPLAAAEHMEAIERPALHILDRDTKGFLQEAPASVEPGNAHGMSAALQESTMQYTHEADESSGAARQNLPSFGDTEDSARNHRQPPAAKAKDGKPASVASNEGAPLVLPIAPDRVADLPGVTPEKGNSPSSRAVMRTVENLAEDLRHGNAVSMVVTLKPDADTHISLHVKQHGGHLEAIAVLERGDFKSLSTEWNHLQTRLAKRGIRLAPLVANGARASDSGSNASSSRQQNQNPLAGELTAPAEITRVSGKSATAQENAKPPVATEWWA